MENNEVLEEVTQETVNQSIDVKGAALIIAGTAAAGFVLYKAVDAVVKYVKSKKETKTEEKEEVKEPVIEAEAA